MSLYKRNNSSKWYYRIYSPNGKQVLQGSTGTDNKAKAQEFHDRLKASTWDQAKLGHKPNYTWNDAVVRYLEEKADISSMETTKIHLRWLDAHLGGVLLSDINRTKIDAITRAKSMEERVVMTKNGPKPLGRRVSPATVNRVMGVMKSVLNASVEWEWMPHAPKSKRLKTATKRVRWLTDEEADLLLSELPPHLADMAQLSLETGLRRANITNLQYTEIDLKRCIAWVHPDKAKARKAIAVPLSPSAVAVIERQRYKPRLPEFKQSVFVYKGREVFQTSTAAWRKAKARAGVANFRWHDLRHTWASWHVQGTTPLQVLKELGGWGTMEMVQRYAHLSAEHLTPYVRSMTKSDQVDCNLTEGDNVVPIRKAVTG